MGDADQEESQSRPEDGAPHADQHELRQRVCIHTVCSHEQGGKDNRHANKDGNGFSEGSTGLCVHFKLLNLMGFDVYRIAVNQEACQVTKDVLWVYFWISPNIVSQADRYNRFNSLARAMHSVRFWAFNLPKILFKSFLTVPVASTNSSAICWLDFPSATSL